MSKTPPQHLDQGTGPSERANRPFESDRLEFAGQLAGEVAHELNTPLGGILMYSHLLLEDMAENDPRRENIVKITKLAHRCRIIVQGLLDFASREHPSLEPVNVNRVFQDVMGFLEDHVLLKPVELQKQLSSSLPRVAGDEIKLEQVFINLILNAAQSMQTGGTLTVRTGFDRTDNSVFIDIADTGCGIEEAEFDKIFEPFYTTRDKGTGLGLSICHGIIANHGGTLTVESSKGRGSTFTIRLPAINGPFDEMPK